MASETTPLYRYRDVAPETLTVPARELLQSIPQELRGETPTEERMIELPCRDLLAGNTPSLALGRLGEIARELVRVPEGRNPSERIALPAGWIALHFRMVTVREEITPRPLLEKPRRQSGALSSEVKKPENSPPEPVVVEILPHKSDVKSEVQEKPESPSAQPVPRESPAPVPAEDPPGEDVEKRATPVPKTGLFSSLPVFRKNETANDGEPPRQPALRESTPSPVLERLWKLDPQDELAEADALQSLFMTEEKLTLEKVVSKAGELPGLDACVLAHGDRVICASKAPAGTDLQSLSGQAMAMLSQIRESSEKMGLGSVPAVTLHADRGVISFLHRGELCLLVMHTDRGFVPGVRERLQEMLVHLDDARPALPGPPGP